jgi:hypothetical protein
MVLAPDKMVAGGRDLILLLVTGQTAAIETRCRTIAGCKLAKADSETTQAGAIAAKMKLACARSQKRRGIGNFRGACARFQASDSSRRRENRAVAGAPL